MKKNGFMLAETLLVTTFIAGVLIYLFVQFYNLNENFNDSYKYNTAEGLYALEDVVELIVNDEFVMTYLDENIVKYHYIDISNCSIFSDADVCKKLLGLENVNEIFITTNTIPKSSIKGYSVGMNKFLERIKASETEPDRVVASFKNNKYATVRFGDCNE